MRKLRYIMFQLKSKQKVKTLCNDYPTRIYLYKPALHGYTIIFPKVRTLGNIIIFPKVLQGGRPNAAIHEINSLPELKHWYLHVITDRYTYWTYTQLTHKQVQEIIFLESL